MEAEQTLVCGEILQDHCTDKDGSKIGKVRDDHQATNVLKTVNTVETTQEFEDETVQEVTISRDAAHQHMTPEREKWATQQADEIVGQLFTKALPTEERIVGERPVHLKHEVVRDGLERTFTTMKMGDSSILRLSLKVGNKFLEAAVDTAAEVTIISDEVYKTLEPRPEVLKETTMHAAGRGMVMKTLVVGPVYVEIGSKSYATEVYVAPIKDEMLLGLNFMVEYGVVVNLRDCTFIIGGEELNLSSGPKSIIPVVSKVRVEKRTVIPPFSVVHVQVKLDCPLEQYVIEQSEEYLPIMIPRCLYNHDHPVACLVNLSDRYYTIKRETVVGTAESVQNTEDPVRATCVTEVKEDQDKEVPEQLTELIDNISSELVAPEKSKLKSLLLEFVDIFSRNEFDIRTFQEVEHGIDTAQNTITVCR